MGKCKEQNFRESTADSKELALGDYKIRFGAYFSNTSAFPLFTSHRVPFISVIQTSLEYREGLHFLRLGEGEQEAFQQNWDELGEFIVM